jgi:thiamine kinase-like enzyme
MLILIAIFKSQSVKLKPAAAKGVHMEYTYLLIDNSIYINLNESLLNLIYLLLFRAKPFSFLERKTNIKVFNFFIPLVRIRRVFQFTYLFYRRKQLFVKSKDSIPAITTTFYGNCLIESRLGEYKIINFGKKNVITVFPKNFPNIKIENNILKLIEAQKCDLAPKIIEWDIKRRFIKECYLNLKSATFDYENKHKFYLEVFPILENIMLSTSPQIVPFSQYQHNLINRIDLLIESYFKKDSYFEKKKNVFLELFTFFKTKLEFYPLKKEILLVLSHGDFWEGNILKGKKKPRVIDWHTLDNRSCYFDFYFIMFDIAFETKNTERTNISNEIFTAFKYFQFYLKENPNFDSNWTTDVVSQANIYRYLFYLEYILLRLEEYPYCNQGDLAYYEKMINFFKLYEINKDVHSECLI